MEITERHEGPILVLSLQGRLDHSGAEIFQKKAVGHIEAGARSIVVDFGGTTFVASMGIRALIIPTQDMSRAGGRIALVGLSPQVRQLFEVTGLLSVFKVYPTLAEAAADGVWA
jgi:anti-anti-sigma factor